MPYFELSYLENRLLKRIIRKAVRQGGHDVRIQSLYQMIRDAAEAEFTEDNWPTLDAFLEELFRNTQRMKNERG